MRWAEPAFAAICQKLLDALATTTSIYAKRLAESILAARYPTDGLPVNPHFDEAAYCRLHPIGEPEPVRMRLVYIHPMPEGMQ